MCHLFYPGLKVLQIKTKLAKTEDWLTDWHSTVSFLTVFSEKLTFKNFTLILNWIHIIIQIIFIGFCKGNWKKLSLKSVFLYSSSLGFCILVKSRHAFQTKKQGQTHHNIENCILEGVKSMLYNFDSTFILYKKQIILLNMFWLL